MATTSVGSEGLMSHPVMPTSGHDRASGIGKVAEETGQLIGYGERESLREVL